MSCGKILPVVKKNRSLKMADQKIIKAAVIGCGGRGRGVTNNLLRDSDKNVKIVSVFDPDKAEAQKGLDRWESPDTRICDSYEEAINTPGVDWVLIFSPNAFHKEHILAAFAAGKNVFSEKPLATSIEDCREIYEAHQKSGLTFMTGFVLRYSKIYRKAKELITSGQLGKVLSVDANENITPAHGGYIMTNWRRSTAISGPHILEKCCHDLDLLNWLIDSLPSKIAAFGSLDYFTPANKGHLEKFGPQTYASWPDSHRTGDAFTIDKDLKDTQVAIMNYRNGVKVQFQATMSNAIPERRMYFSCSEGTMILELYSSTLQYRRIGEVETKVINYGADGHGGGDAFIMKELYDCMVNGTPPKSSGNEGLESAVTALGIDTAMCEEKVLDMEPIWKKLGR